MAAFWCTAVYERWFNISEGQVIIFYQKEWTLSDLLEIR